MSSNPLQPDPSKLQSPFMRSARPDPGFTDKYERPGLADLPLRPQLPSPENEYQLAERIRPGSRPLLVNYSYSSDGLTVLLTPLWKVQRGQPVPTVAAGGSLPSDLVRRIFMAFHRASKRLPDQWNQDEARAGHLAVDKLPLLALVDLEQPPFPVKAPRKMRPHEDIKADVERAEQKRGQALEYAEIEAFLYQDPPPPAWWAPKNGSKAVALECLAESARFFDFDWWDEEIKGSGDDDTAWTPGGAKLALCEAARAYGLGIQKDESESDEDTVAHPAWDVNPVAWPRVPLPDDFEDPVYKALLYARRHFFEVLAAAQEQCALSTIGHHLVDPWVQRIRETLGTNPDDLPTELWLVPSRILSVLPLGAARILPPDYPGEAMPLHVWRPLRYLPADDPLALDPANRANHPRPPADAQVRLFAHNRQGGWSDVDAKVGRIQQIMDGPHSGRIECCIGEDFSLPSFRQRAPQTRVIHLLTHGVYDVQNELNSYVVLPKPDGQPDRLTIADLLDGSLDLRAVDFLYLQACEGAYGEADLNDEVLNLGLAFLTAGVRCVVLHLYPVSYEHASMVAERFYETWCRPQSGKWITVAEAHRQTMAYFHEHLEELRQAGDSERTLRFLSEAFLGGFYLVGDGHFAWPETLI